MSAALHPAAGDLRALTLLDTVPPGCRALPIGDDRHAPHLRAGAVAVIDPADCDPVHGELFAVQYGRRPAVMQTVWRTTGDLAAWWCVGLDDPRSWAECEARMSAGRMLPCADGPYGPGCLEERTLGRVVGLLQPSSPQVSHGL